MAIGWRVISALLWIVVLFIANQVTAEPPLPVGADLDVLRREAWGYAREQHIDLTEARTSLEHARAIRPDLTEALVGAGYDLRLADDRSDKDLGRLHVIPKIRGLLLEGIGFTDAAAKYVAAMPDLDALACHCTGISDDGLNHLSGLRRLQWLSITQRSLKGITFSRLDALGNLPRLRYLSLTGISAPELNMTKGFPCLEHIVCDADNVRDICIRGLQRLSDVTIECDTSSLAVIEFKDLSQLRGVHIHGDPIGRVPTRLVLSSVPKLQRISIAAAFSQRDCEQFKELRNVRSLKVRCAGVTTSVLSRVSQMEELEELDISFDPVGSSDADLQFLSRLTNVQRLNLSSAGLTGSRLRYVAELPALRQLQLSSNDLTNQSLAALSRSRSLRQLSLSSNERIGDDGMKWLVDMDRLEELDVSATGITDEGTATLASLPKMRRLKLSFTHIGDGGIRKLSALRGLEELDVSHTRVSDVGIELLRSHPGLRHVRAFGSEASLAVIEKVNDELKKRAGRPGAR